MNILVTGGGTGGHLYPGLELSRHFLENGHNVYYVASSNGVDKEIIASENNLDNIKFSYWDLSGLSRKKSFSSIAYNFKSISKLFKASKRAKKYLKSNEIDVVIGVGGYVSYPLVKEAVKLKIKTIIHEQNSYPGLVNKKLAKSVEYLTGAYPQAEKYFKREVINASNPRVDKAHEYLNKKFYEELDLDPEKEIVLFLGGSLGADTINNLFLNFIKKDINNEYLCILISGMLNNDLNGADIKDNIVLEGTNKLLKYLATSDYVISRGGATTLLEIINLEKKSIIIPSPNVVANHQYYNAILFEQEQMLYMIEEKDLNFDKFEEVFKELKVDSKIKNKLQKYDKISSLEIFDNLIRS